MPKDLNADQLVEAAQRSTGLEDFDSMSFREGLELYCSDFNRNKRSDEAVDNNSAVIIKNLADRLKISEALRQRPEVLDAPVKAPVFVIGGARTGTTLLNNLLAADPHRRSALTWEIEEPVPPPTTATLFNDPRALAQIEAQRQLLEAYPDAGKYYRSSPIYPNECIFFLNHDFKTLFWEGRAKLPNYRDWLFSTDMTSAYTYHKKFLQLHQADAPGIWNLKMPSHALWLDTILKIYPDARLIWTHRDPLTATGSFCSLMRLSMNNGIGYADLPWIAENFPWQQEQQINRIMDFREKHGHDRVIDVHYGDMMRDPMVTMRKVYAALGDEFTPEAEAGMQTWVDDNPQGKFGRHEYKLGEFGLTPEQVRPRFARYLEAYDVESEG